jgi:hypothetical protein
MRRKKNFVGDLGAFGGEDKQHRRRVSLLVAALLAALVWMLHKQFFRRFLRSGTSRPTT